MQQTFVLTGRETQAEDSAQFPSLGSCTKPRRNNGGTKWWKTETFEELKSVVVRNAALQPTVTLI